MTDKAHTLFLEDDWDIHTDISGNLARTFEDYSIAQNVANAFRLFTDDAWYFPEKGIPHFALELNRHPKLAVLKSKLKQAAMQIEGVKDCEIMFLNLETRELSGTAVLTLESGQKMKLTIGQGS